MGRNIILDGHVISEINCGNKTAADTVLQLKQDGAALYMSQQGMWELTNKQEAAANVATLYRRCARTFSTRTPAT